MLVLNKYEKEKLAIQMHKEGKTIRDIVSAAHLSSSDIGKIIRRVDGWTDNNNNNSNDVDLGNKSKSTQALYLFEHGKKPIDIVIELDIPYSEVEELQQEYWSLKELYDLAFAYIEIKNDLSSFVKLFKLLNRNKMIS